ncbi:hypothetical protein T492DRAFT_1104529 [Pavlovales sp. CCMP2436]|nr:hypothetical protein T492DRAFT_1104529 [Pavlovales sp. CCMP2436]
MSMGCTLSAPTTYSWARTAAASHGEYVPHPGGSLDKGSVWRDPRWVHDCGDAKDPAARHGRPPLLSSIELEERRWQAGAQVLDADAEGECSGCDRGHLSLIKTKSEKNVESKCGIHSTSKHRSLKEFCFCFF